MASVLLNPFPRMVIPQISLSVALVASSPFPSLISSPKPYTSMSTVTLSKSALFREVARANRLRGRQKIVDYWRDGDEWVFDSNAHGDGGETLTFHYADTRCLLTSLGLCFSGWDEISLSDEVIA